MPFASMFQIGLLRFAGRRTPGERTPPKPRLALDPTAEHLWKVMLPSTTCN